MIDVFYKLKALHASGFRIILHCFEYGRRRSAELEALCEKVFYYRRRTGKHLLLHSLPFIVISRRSDELVKNLAATEAPVLFEGLHCCFHLDDPRLRNRKRIVRMHNIEHAYYGSLAAAERNFFKKKYYESESSKLRSYEMILDHATSVAAISPGDTAELSGRFRNVINVPAFHPHEKVEGKEGFGDFSLYHGNLGVAENNRAALYLAKEVFAGTEFKLVIAGNKPSAELRQEAARYPNVTVSEGLSTEEIHKLIRKAHINILPTFQSTGIKLKLLAALYLGRHCLVNGPMVENTGLDVLCMRADTAVSMQDEVRRLMRVEFRPDERTRRESVLGDKFSVAAGVRKLSELL